MGGANLFNQLKILYKQKKHSRELIKCSTVCSANRQDETTSPQAVLCRVSHIFHLSFPSFSYSDYLTCPSFFHLSSFHPSSMYVHFPLPTLTICAPQALVIRVLYPVLSQYARTPRDGVTTHLPWRCTSPRVGFGLISILYLTTALSSTKN